MMQNIQHRSTRVYRGCMKAKADGDVDFFSPSLSSLFFSAVLFDPLTPLVDTPLETTFLLDFSCAAFREHLQKSNEIIIRNVKKAKRPMTPTNTSTGCSGCWHNRSASATSRGDFKERRAVRASGHVCFRCRTKKDVAASQTRSNTSLTRSTHFGRKLLRYIANRSAV